MKKYRVLLVIFLSLLFFHRASSSEVNECNSNLISSIGNYLKISNFSYYDSDNGEELSFNGGKVLIRATCKIWPYDPKKMIIVFSYYDENYHINPDANGQHMNFLAGIINTSDYQVLSTYKWAGVYILNKQNGSIEIDTARYDLAPGKRAFGIDIENGYYQSTVSGGTGAVRTLFIQDGENLKPVLREFVLSEWSYVDQSVVSSQFGGDRSIQNIKYSIGIGKTSTNGFRDLEISESITYDIEDKLKNVGLKNSTKISKVLHFNGKEY